MENSVDIEYKRKIYDKLLAWANSKDKEDAILIEGARRVGKTTIAKKLGREAYEDYLYIDFKIASDELKELFSPKRMQDLDSFFQELFLFAGKFVKPGSLIIFDEVQYCLDARQDIKYLVADGRYDYLETGSLITILSNEQGIQIPSEETILYMFPLDFEEYLWAKGDTSSLPMLAKMVEEKKDIPEAIHQKFLGEFRKYMLLGGMPQSLAALQKSNSYIEAEKAKKRILSLYYGDLKRYDERHGTICELLFKDIPAQLAQERESYRYIPDFEGINASRSAVIEKSLRALKDFLLIDIVYRSPDLSSFLETKKDTSFYKLYYGDTGLLLTALLSMTEEETKDDYIKFIRGESGINLGGIMESVVSQMLSARQIQKFYHIFYYKPESSSSEKRYEIDFAFKYRLSNILLEVKSAKHYKSESLDRFDEKYPHIKSHKFVVGIKNYHREETKTTLPIYLLPLLRFC